MATQLTATETADRRSAARAGEEPHRPVPGSARLADEARRISAAAAVAVFLVQSETAADPPNLLIRAATNGTIHGESPSLAMLSGATLGTLLAGEAVVIPDLARSGWPLLADGASGCLAGVPLRSAGGRLFGFLLVADPTPNTVSHVVIEQLMSLGQDAERWLGSPPLGLDSGRSTRDSNLLGRATAALNRAQRLPEIVRELIHHGAHMPEVDSAGAFLFREGGGGIRLAARCGQTYDQQSGRAVGICTWIELGAFGDESDNIPADQIQAELARALSIPPDVQALVLPLRLRDQLVGGFWLARVQDRPPFDLRDAELLGGLGAVGIGAIERGLLIEAEGRQRRETAAMLRVAAALNESVTLGDLLPALARVAAEAVTADRVSVYVYDADQTRTVAAAHFGGVGADEPPPNELVTLDPMAPADFPAEVEVIRTRQPLVRDAGSPFIDPFPIEGWRSDVIVPLLAENSVQGVLYVREVNRPRHFAADDLVLLQAIGQQAGLAILRARDAEAVARHASDLAAVLAVTRAVVSAPDLATTLDVLSEELTSLIPHYESCLFQLTPDATRLVPILYRRAGSTVRLADASLQANEGLCGFALETGTAVRVNDAHLDPRSTYFENEPATEVYRSGGEHVMVAPLTIGAQSIGVLFLNRLGDATPFTESELALFRVLAEQAAAAIRGAELRDDALIGETRAARHAANLEAVLATTRAITAQIELPQILGTLADHLERLIPHERLTIWRLDSGARLYRPLVARVGRRPVDLAVAISTRDELFGSLMRRSTPIQVRPDGAVGGTRLLVPLVVKRRAIGVIDLVRGGDEAFPSEDLDVIRVLAPQAAVAIQGSLLFAKERRRQRHAAALVEAAAALNLSTTLDEVMDRLTSLAAAAVGVDRCTLYVYSEDTNSTIASYGLSALDDQLVEQWSPYPPSRFPIGQELLSTRRPVRGRRLAALFRQKPEANTTMQRGGAVLPLRIGDRVQGALYIWEHRAGDGPPREFDRDELTLLEAICDQAAVAIERARLHADTEHRIAQLRAVSGVNTAVTETLELRPMLWEALTRIGEATVSQLTLVTLPDEDAEVLRIVECVGAGGDGLVGVAVPIDRSLNGRVFRTGEPFVGDNFHDPSLFAPPGWPAIYPHLVCVPLTIEGRTIGTLQVLRSSDDPFTESDLELLGLIAGQLAVGIERARVVDIAVAARERSERQARNLETVLTGSRALALQSDLPSTLEAFCDGLLRLVPYLHAVVYRADLGSGELVRLHQRSLGGLEVVIDRVPFGTGIVGAIAERHEPVRFDHVERHPSFRPRAWRAGATLERGLAEGIHSIVVPLMVEGALLGVAAVSRTEAEGGPFTDDEYASVQVFAGQGAAAIRNAELVAHNRDLYFGVVRALASMVDAKDHYTRGHAERVSSLARQIAEALGLPREETETIELAGLLHDIGKIGVPDRILQKAGPLDDADRVTMMGHAAQGAEIVAQAGIQVLQPLVPLIRHHHEWVNGNGYPDRLAGDQIPLGAAVIAVADAFDTLVTDRPYRIGRTSGQAIAELRRCVGTQFSSDIVEALASVLPADETSLAIEAAPEGDRSLAALENEESPFPVELDAGPGGTVGRMGDSRPLAVLVDLAKITRHMPDLQTFLGQLPTIVQHRLGYDDVALFLVGDEQSTLQLAAHTGSHRRFRPDHRRAVERGVPHQVATTGRPANAADIRTRPDFDPLGPADTGSELGVPLIVDAATIGVLSVASAKSAAFTANDQLTLTAIADQLAMAVHVARLHAAAKHAAATDQLTGLANHRAFYQELERAVALSSPFAIILFDVEGLKATNDGHGHLAGDALLRHVGRTIRAHVRAGDLVARYGGDEFAVVMYGAGRNDAAAVASRIRADLLATTGVAGPSRTTVRYGVAVLPSDGTGPYELVGVADARLYRMRAAQARRNEINLDDDTLLTTR